MPTDKQSRVIMWSVLSTVAGAVAVWIVMVFLPSSIASAHADAHDGDLDQLKSVIALAASNAEYINSQILATLYLRANRLRSALETNPSDSGAREALANAEVEITRREANLQ